MFLKSVFRDSIRSMQLYPVRSAYSQQESSMTISKTDFSIAIIQYEIIYKKNIDMQLNSIFLFKNSKFKIFSFKKMLLRKRKMLINQWNNAANLTERIQ